MTYISRKGNVFCYGSIYSNRECLAGMDYSDNSSGEVRGGFEYMDIRGIMVFKKVFSVTVFNLLGVYCHYMK